MRITFLFILLFSITHYLFAQNGGWESQTELVEQMEEQRPGYLWRESMIPAYGLPHPLKTSGSTMVQNPGQWQQRRSDILDLFRSQMYGHRPGPPEYLSFNVIEEDPKAMNGAALLRRVSIQSQHQGRKHEFELILLLPGNTQKPVPVFLLMNNRDKSNTDPTRREKSGFWPAEEVINRGYGIAAIQNNELAPDDTDRFHEEVIRLFEGENAAVERDPETWGALAAWGWGASRVMDYFETDSGVDASKVAVLGHSRGGKAALWAGAEDERFSLVISNDSGCGGAALSRRKFGETVRAINRFTHWFAGNFDAYNDREHELPFDQHMLISLIAPRAVYVASADEDLWADPRGEFLSMSYASPVYALWNHYPIRVDEMPPLDQPLIAGPRGYHVRSGGHNLTPQDWGYYMDFADHLWRQK